MKKIYHCRTSHLLSMRFIAKLTVCLLLSSTAYSQTVNDVLEKGNYVKKASDIYFKLDSIFYIGVLNKKDAGKPIDYEFNADSVLFLTSDNNTDVFIQPLNPLNFTIGSISKLVPDAISKAESDALKTIGELLADVNKNLFQDPLAGGAGNDPSSSIQQCMLKVENGLARENNNFKEMNKIFNALKKLDFEQQIFTHNQFNEAVKNMGIINKNLNDIDSMIQLIDADSKIFGQDSDSINIILQRYVYRNYVHSIRDAYNIRKRQFTNLEKAKDLVYDAINKADKYNWHFKLSPISVTKAENAVYTVAIDTNAWNMNDEGVLVQKSGGKKISRTIIIRKFQLLVPEVSVGTYYTFFKYKVYGTITDSTGQQFVAEPTFNTLKRFNASVMLNYNFYIPNTPIRPLLQFGGGIQSGIPVLMAGGGLRIGNSNAFSITGGVALTWIRELQTLKVGDRVSGTAELEKDLKYEFSFPLKGYVGIQYNF